MLKNIYSAVVVLAFAAIFNAVGAQTPAVAVKPSVVAGDVVSLGDKKIVVNTSKGPVEIVITEQTAFKRVSAVNPDFKQATDGTLGEVGVGDKLTVTGIMAADGKSLPARSLYYITKADLAEKNAKESEEWRRRGIAGKVIAVNPATNQITIEVRGLVGSTNAVITPKEDAKFLRYAPDSIRFDEAVASTLSDIKVGDMFRAKGDKSSDGGSFAAEQIITGAFQTIAGTVTSVDAEKNELVIKNLQTNKEITVIMGDVTLIKRFPAEMAERLAGAPGPGGGAARPVARGEGQGQGRPGGAPEGRGGGRFGAGAAGGIDDMIDRFPSISVTDLKVGDMIALSSSKNGNAERIKAIKVLAGVEPFIRMAQASSGGRRGQAVDGNFTIPGLDSIGFP